MAIEKNRNYAFDLLKLLFTFIIIIHHSSLSRVLVRGYIAVEFFFFVSGYFISSKIEEGTPFSSYMKSRIQKLYPGYLCAYVLILIPFLVTGNAQYKAFYGPLLEVLLLQNVGIPRSGGINYPLWYLSVLFYGGSFVYIARKILNKRWFNIIGGIIVALTYGFLAFQAQKIEYWGYAFKVFSVPFWRGVSDLIIGMWLYQLPKLPARIEKHIQLVSFFLSIALLFIPGKLDFFAIVPLAVLVYSSTAQNSVFSEIGKAGILRSCYSYQYFAYLNHAVAIYGNRFLFSIIAKYVEIPAIVQLLSLLVTVAILAFVSKRITDFGYSRLSRMLTVNRKKHG